MEFLVTMTTHVPDGAPEKTVGDARAREAAHAAELEAILASLPLYPYLTTQVTRLTPHPSDPAAAGSRPPVRERIGTDHG